MYLAEAVATPAVLDTTAVMVGRWASVVISVGLLLIALAAMIFTSHRPTRIIIGVGAVCALVALGMRVALLFSGTG